MLFVLKVIKFRVDCGFVLKVLGIYIIYFYCFLFNLDYMVIKLKEDGLDNVYIEVV